jgi:hypothetical protein
MGPQWLFKSHSTYSFPFPAIAHAGQWLEAFNKVERFVEVSYRLQRRARFRFTRNSSLCDEPVWVHLKGGSLSNFIPFILGFKPGRFL